MRSGLIQQSGIYAVQRFARTLQQDITAVKNALTERWSNGQTEGQINRLKTLRRGITGASDCTLCSQGIELFSSAGAGLKSRLSFAYHVDQFDPRKDNVGRL
jgi:hypothetical protein